MPVRTKSIYDPAEPCDGWRVLTTNYWPRGISKAHGGTYKRVLGPSRELLRAFKDGAIGWPAYEKAYLEEMRDPVKVEEIRGLAGIAREDTVTVMCVCREDAHCHRRLLQKLIEREMDDRPRASGLARTRNSP